MALSNDKLNGYFKDYASHHRTRGNQMTHFLGIPLIVISTLGLFSLIRVVGGAADFLRLDGGVILLALSLIWYLTLDWKIAVPFGLFASGLYFLGRSMPLPMLVLLFVGGWVVQFVGHHVYEKKSPAFYANLRHLLIGPLWIFSKWVGYTR